MKTIATFVILYFPILLIGQINRDSIGILKGEIEFVIIKSGKGVLFENIDTIYSGEFFNYMSNNEGCVKVTKYNGKVGFIDNDNVQPLLELDTLNILLTRIFQQELSNYRDNDIPIKDYKNYQKLKFYPATSVFKDYQCKNNDESLMILFLEIAYHENSSAQEIVPSTLATIYICKPEWTLDIIRNQVDWKNKLLKQLRQGFGLITSGQENSMDNYLELKNKIEKE